MPGRPRNPSPPLRIAVIYLAAALAWVWLSDLALLIGEGQSLHGFLASATKGTISVVLSSLPVYWLVRRAALDGALLRAVAEGTADAVFVKDRDGKYLLFNAAAARFVEAALRESESRFRGAFEDTNVATVLTDIDNRLVRVNEAFARLFGYTREEMLTMSMASITHPDHLAESYARREGLMSGSADHFEMQKRYLHKDGHEIWAVTNVWLVSDPEGRPRLYVGQVQDVTERKRAEAT